MQLIGNKLNGRFPEELVRQANAGKLTQIDLAVAYVTKMDSIFELAKGRDVPLNLYALATGDGFPAYDLARKFVEGNRLAWRLFLRRGFFHPKVMWFRGIGAYIGSANLTDQAWYRNYELGVWLPQEDLEQANWIEELGAIFQVIQRDSREATEEDLAALRALHIRQLVPLKAQQDFDRATERALVHLPGGRAPIDTTSNVEPGGEAKAAFLREWNQGITVLRKISAFFAERRDSWPDWVDKDVPASIVQDQATEWWWHNKFRLTRESRRLIETSHSANTRDPDEAVNSLFAGWRDFKPMVDGGNWLRHMNETPQLLRRLLSIDQLRTLDEDGLRQILFLCHSAREHGRQIPNIELGLEPDKHLAVEERSPLYAQYLWRQRSHEGRSIRDLIMFAIWGDRVGTVRSENCAERIWSAARDDRWRLPHIGVHILGELIGYGRPDEYPPRNNRVSKTLFALGFSGIDYQ